MGDNQAVNATRLINDAFLSRLTRDREMRSIDVIFHVVNTFGRNVRVTSEVISDFQRIAST